MIRVIIALAILAFAPLAQAADAIVPFQEPTGLSLTIEVRTSATADISASLTEGTGDGAGWYTIDESTLVTAGLNTAGKYGFAILNGSEVIREGTLYWSGSTAVLEQVNLTQILGATLSGGVNTNTLADNFSTLFVNGDVAATLTLDDVASQASVDGLPTAAEVWSSATRTITGGTITTNNDKAGYSLTVTPPTATEVRDAIFGAARAAFDVAGTFGEGFNEVYARLPAGGRVIAAAGDTATNLDQVEGGGGGTSEPRVNFDPAPGFTRVVPITGVVALPIRLNAGAVDEVVPLDLSQIYGKAARVQTVGTPAIDGGTITVESVGPHDYFAYVGLGGTAVAGEVRTVTVEISMRGGQTRTVQFTINVAG